MLRTKLFAGLLVCVAAFAQPLPMTKSPEDAGFSSKRLEKTRQAIKGDVESKRVPGALECDAPNSFRGGHGAAAHAGAAHEARGRAAAPLELRAFPRATAPPARGRAPPPGSNSPPTPS